MNKKKAPGLKRRSPVADGILYPGNGEALKEKFVSWGLESCSDVPPFKAVIAPHAAWTFSNFIAGTAFACLTRAQDKKSGRTLKTVVLLGPCHKPNEEGIFLSESAFFKTPLGSLRVDSKLNRGLLRCGSPIRINDIPHLEEHSIEVLLPIIKYCFPRAKIVPILISGQRPSLVSCLASGLKQTLEKCMEECLIVISSHISQHSDPATALFMAEEFQRLIEKPDAERFNESLSSGLISACGGSLASALFESGLLNGEGFSPASTLTRGTDENGETFYYGAFIC